jgi:hypothetical protein
LLVVAAGADEYLKVHPGGRIQADVTEGSEGVWERLHYDWSDPNHFQRGTELTPNFFVMVALVCGITYKWPLQTRTLPTDIGGI